MEVFYLLDFRERNLPLRAPIQSILDYLLHLKQQSLALSSIKVHLAAISAFHPPVQGKSVFSHEMTIWFLKGLERLYPQVSQWDLNLGLLQLMGPVFELMASYSLLLLSWKVAFLVAVALASRDQSPNFGTSIHGILQGQDPAASSPGVSIKGGVTVSLQPRNIVTWFLPETSQVQQGMKATLSGR